MDGEARALVVDPGADAVPGQGSLEEADGLEEVVVVDPDVAGAPNSALDDLGPGEVEGVAGLVLGFPWGVPVEFAVSRSPGV